MVNRLIQLALADEALPIYGDGRQRRDYVHVDDVVSALVRMSESSSSDGVAFNVGSGVGTRMVDMAAAIIDMAGGGRIEHVPWPSLAGLIETGDFVADVSRMRARLDWTPALSLSDGLRKTIAFYQTHVSSERAARALYLSHAFMVGGAKKWCSTWFVIFRTVSSPACRVSIRPGPLARKSGTRACPFACSVWIRASDGPGV